jgi:hypothetical protein
LASQISGPLVDAASFADRGPRAVSPGSADCAKADGAKVWGAAARSSITAIPTPGTEIARNKFLSCFRKQRREQRGCFRRN